MQNKSGPSIDPCGTPHLQQIIQKTLDHTLKYLLHLASSFKKMLKMWIILWFQSRQHVAWYPSCRGKMEHKSSTLSLESSGEQNVPKVNAPGRYAKVKGTVHSFTLEPVCGFSAAQPRLSFNSTWFSLLKFQNFQS